MKGTTSYADIAGSDIVVVTRSASNPVGSPFICADPADIMAVTSGLPRTPGLPSYLCTRAPGAARI
eukprot:2857121-Rhodomonas_salina.1